LIELIERAGLKKTMEDLNNCFENLVKEFLVNISKNCNNNLSKEFRIFFVRGRCVEFSLEVINRFLGRNEEACVEVEVTDDQICKEITAQQVKQWPVKGKLQSVKYALVHKIGASN
jgi:hypothetical protein